MEIFILYKFYIFFILKSYLKTKTKQKKKKRCALKPELQNIPVREMACVSGLSTDSMEERRRGNERITGFSFSTSVGQRPRFSFTTVSVFWGSNSLNISTLTPEGINEKCLLPSSKYQMMYFNITPNPVYVYVHKETDKRLIFLNLMLIINA